MAQNRPGGRQRNVTGNGKSINRRGTGLGTGPVGSTPKRPTGSSLKRPTGSSKRPVGNSQRPANSTHRYSSTGTSRPVRSVRSGGSMKWVILLLIMLFGGGGSIGSLFSDGSFLGGGDSWLNIGEYQSGNHQTSPGTSAGSASSGGSSYGGSGSGGNATVYYPQNLGGSALSGGWDSESNTESLNTQVVSGTRDKYTEVIGNGKDEVTIMLYLCGTDLESRNKMATSDLQEMLNADIAENVNLLVYTGGCKAWQNNVISSQTNQIWQVKDEGLLCLEKDLGGYSMTDPDTLTWFINWCAQKFPANRNALIFWDHGGGSVSGFGYDEKFSNSGSMGLAKIDQALTKANIKFDFIGFDACLMATAENALMLTEHADYLIASEETEPGIGWYYTNWLTGLSQNTSMSTLEIGKQIIDDFVDTCAAKCPGQPTTLSIVDLAEAESLIPDALAAFSKETCELIENDNYAQVSNARSNAREFGRSSKIDQVDLVHLAQNMGTKEGQALADALLQSVKYNRTSYNMTNSYGLSIYFPFRKASMVDKAVGTYEQIGMDEEYMRCIQAFASVETGGQAVSGGTQTPLPALMEILGSGSSAYGNAEMISQVLGSFLGGDVSSILGLYEGNTGFLDGRILEQEKMAKYYAENAFDSSLLVWKKNGADTVITLPEEQWELVQTLQANMFYDDGEGYIDLGMDNVYDFDEAGNLLAPEEMTWIAVNEQPVAYYHESTVDDGEDYCITGRIPVLYNGDRAELVVTFTDEDPYGTVSGVRRVYKNGETDTVAKTMDTVQYGDVIDFVCDYYSYDGEYLDSYILGEQLIVEDELMISDVYVDSEAAELTYLFTDIYNQSYWTEPVK